MVSPMVADPTMRRLMSARRKIAITISPVSLHQSHRCVTTLENVNDDVDARLKPPVVNGRATTLCMSRGAHVRCMSRGAHEHQQLMLTHRCRDSSRYRVDRGTPVTRPSTPALTPQCHMHGVHLASYIGAAPPLPPLLCRTGVVQRMRALVTKREPV